jgi:hypothetical protein
LRREQPRYRSLASCGREGSLGARGSSATFSRRRRRLHREMPRAGSRRPTSFGSRDSRRSSRPASRTTCRLPRRG